MKQKFIKAPEPKGKITILKSLKSGVLAGNQDGQWRFITYRDFDFLTRNTPEVELDEFPIKTQITEDMEAVMFTKRTLDKDGREGTMQVRGEIIHLTDIDLAIVMDPVSRRWFVSDVFYSEAAKKMALMQVRKMERAKKTTARQERTK